MTPLLTPYLIKKRIGIVSKYVHGAMLDIGCGDAQILDLLDKHTYYVGIDYDKKMEGIIKDRAEKNDINAHFHQLNLETESFPDLGRKFDTITMIAVIEHLSNPKEIIVNLSHHLKDSGRLIITTPHPMAEKFHCYGAKLGFFSQEAVDDHEKLYDCDSINQLLISSGYAITEYRKFEFGLNQLFCAKLE